MRRKIIQFQQVELAPAISPYQAARHSLTALCDDGTLWLKESLDEEWHEILTPQGESTEEAPSAQEAH